MTSLSDARKALLTVSDPEAVEALEEFIRLIIRDEIAMQGGIFTAAIFDRLAAMESAQRTPRPAL